MYFRRVFAVYIRKCDRDEGMNTVCISNTEIVKKKIKKKSLKEKCLETFD